MTAALKTPVFSKQDFLTPQTKFVDDARQGKSFLAERLAAAGCLGGAAARSIFFKSDRKDGEKNSVGGIDVNRLHFDSIEGRAAAREKFRKIEEEHKARTAEMRAEFLAAYDGRIDFYDLIERDFTFSTPHERDEAEHRAWLARRDADEEARENEFRDLDVGHIATNPQLDRYDRIKALLPTPFHRFFDQFDETRLKERLDAIVDKVGWKTLGLLDLDPFKLEAEADKAAWAYAQKHPESDKRFQKGEHRRGRTKKVWRARLAKDVRDALSYIAMNLGAVGGADEDKRQLYVADFNVNRYRADQFKSREHMSKLRIVNKTDPTAQIPMLEANKRKKIAEAAKRRMWLDIQEYRAESIGARAIWTTLTLPGEFHPNPTNSTPNENSWKPDLGPKEAMETIQERYRQSINLMRWHKIRPWGFHVVQAQQDSTPHRHGLFFVHDMDEEITDQAASDAKVLELARGVVREFRERFPGDYGCDARIIGDDNEEFRPETGKNGKEETVASVIRYAARYATRNIADGDGFCEAVGDVGGDGDGWKTQEERPASDLERHAVWATERRARVCNMVGLDSRRSPSKIWEAVWKAADRGELPDDPRMSAAVELMIQARRFLDELVILQAEYRDFKASKREDEEYEAESLAELKRLQRAVTGCAYHSSVMMGLWQDFDLHRNERAWMRDYFGLTADDDLPLAPIPLRSVRQNVFDEDVKQIDGIAAAHLVAKGGKSAEKPELKGNEVTLTAPDGSWVIVRPSDETKQQIILRVDEWEILDKDEAKKRANEVYAARLEKQNERLEGDRAAYVAETMAVSPENSVEEGKTTHATSDGDEPLALIAFDPSNGADAPHLGALPPADPPPV